MRWSSDRSAMQVELPEGAQCLVKFSHQVVSENRRPRRFAFSSELLRDAILSLFKAPKDALVK